MPRGSLWRPGATPSADTTRTATAGGSPRYLDRCWTDPRWNWPAHEPDSGCGWPATAHSRSGSVGAAGWSTGRKPHRNSVLDADVAPCRSCSYWGYGKPFPYKFRIRRPLRVCAALDDPDPGATPLRAEQHARRFEGDMLEAIRALQPAGQNLQASALRALPRAAAAVRRLGAIGRPLPPPPSAVRRPPSAVLGPLDGRRPRRRKLDPGAGATAHNAIPRSSAVTTTSAMRSTNSYSARR